MTIFQAIRTADRLEPNDYSDETKLRWLSDFDGQVWRDVILTHKGAPRTPFRGYDGTTDIESTRLLIPAPYEEIYPAMLSVQISTHNADSDRLVVAANEFQRLWGSFTDWYNRTHQPCGVRAVRF